MANVPAQIAYRLNHAVYILALTKNNKPHPIPNTQDTAFAFEVIKNSNGQLNEFRFSVNPQQVRPQQPARMNVQAAREWSNSDQQGLSAPTWEVHGMFPWTEVHQHNQYDHQRALEEFMAYFFTYNKNPVNTTILEMRFHDFFQDQHWIVLPSMIPLGQRDNSSPMTENYNLTLQGIRPLVTARATPNATTQALESDLTQQLIAACPNVLNSVCQLSTCEHFGVSNA
jgi:hypothetical protein